MVMVMLLASGAPVLGGSVDEFTDGSGEVVLDLAPGVPDNASRIAFPPDSRVREASATLKVDQTTQYAHILADGGNMSAWYATPESLDMRVMDPEALMGIPFDPQNLTKIALNSTDSAKTTVSGNVSAHLFEFDLGTLLGGAERDLRIGLDWTGMGIQQSIVDVDTVALYIADFARVRWHMWDQHWSSPSTGTHVHFHKGLGPYSGWTNGNGHLYVLAVVAPSSIGAGTSLTTSYVELEVWHTFAPSDLAVDVGGDGTPEFGWNGTGAGLYGLQNELEDGADEVTIDFYQQPEHSNFSSLLVPAGADLVDAKVALAGQPGDVVTPGPEQPSYVEAYGLSGATRVTGIPEYAEPVWAQVTLSNIKNAGMKDQVQDVISDGRTLGNYGSGSRSIAQTFKPAMSGKLVFINVSMEGAVYPDAPNITVEIRTTNASGHPDTNVVGSTLINGSHVSQPSAVWYTAFFEDVELIVGTEYAIVLSVPSAVPTQTYEWKNHFQVSGDPYRYGTSLVSDTPDGSGPWAPIANTDQAFITFMETDILPGDLSKIKVAGETYTAIQPGPSGPVLVYNVARVTKDEFGVWRFAITNANPFPVSFNWTAEVHSDVYPQDFGIALGTDVGSAAFYSYVDDNITLRDVRWLAFTDELAGIIDGAGVAYTAPNGVEFVRVNVSAQANVTGSLVMSGLRVRYYLDVAIAGPEVTAAAEAYRAANAHMDPVEVPFVVSSASEARVLLADPHLLYDLTPTFTAATQIFEEDTGEDVDLDTMFGDDYDNNNLTYEVVGMSEEDVLVADLNDTMLNLTPVEDYYGELDVTVRGTDSSGQYVEGSFRVVVVAVNDAPVIGELPTFSVQAKVTRTLDLSANISDVDNDPGDLEVQVDSSFITVSGMLLYVTFDAQGTRYVNLTVGDGELTDRRELVFDVSPAVGFPSISGLPSSLKVHINRPLPMTLTQFGSDPEDAAEDLVWEASEESDLFTITLEGHLLTITPTGVAMGNGTLFLALTDTDDHTVREEVTVNITERFLEAPRINHDTLPDNVKLKKGGQPKVIDLADHVEDETPVADLMVEVTYSKEDIVYVDFQDGILTIVPQKVGETRVSFVLRDTDDQTSTFEIEVDVEEEGADDEIDWTLWIILLIILALIVALVAWPRRAPGEAEPVDIEPRGMPPRPRIDKVKPHMFRSSSLRQLEEVLLFHSSGLLVSQYTREIREGVDADLEGAVISAVQDHIRGRMRARDEPTDLIELEDMHVVIERGADLAIAAVLSGAEPVGMRKQLRRTLNEVQTRNADTLTDWDGDLAQLRGVDNAMVNLVEALIKEHNGSLDLAVDGEAVSRPHRPPRVVEGVPALEDEDEPLKLVKDIIGEDKVREIEEGRHEEPPELPDGEEEEEAE